MIFILAGAYSHAKRWAQAQQLNEDEWFCSLDVADIHARENFHVIILESASELPPKTFERIYTLAQTRGRMNRK
jgi:hypothetical protein